MQVGKPDALFFLVFEFFARLAREIRAERVLVIFPFVAGDLELDVVDVEPVKIFDLGQQGEDVFAITKIPCWIITGIGLLGKSSNFVGEEIECS